MRVRWSLHDTWEEALAAALLIAEQPDRVVRPRVTRRRRWIDHSLVWVVEA